MKEATSTSVVPPLPNLVELARWRAQVAHDAIAFTYLPGGEGEEEQLSYGELDRRARLLAVQLRALGQPGDRVLLLYGFGLEYIVAFFGSMYAGMLPVPAHPPDPMRRDRTLPRLQAIAQDCLPTVILGTKESLSWTGSLLAEAVSGVKVLATDAWRTWTDDSWSPAQTTNELAFLQYTSGSTNLPRGIMVTQQNILYQLREINRYDHAQALGVSWLPLYHDLGLVAGVLAPIYGGRRVVLFSPLAFVQRPMRWLQAISKYRATRTGGPNFAYDLCVRKHSPEELVDLDLSCWEVALSGGELVRPETLERFTRTFAPFGFRAAAWSPCYGMAEATLGVTGGAPLATEIHAEDFSTAALAQNRAKVISEIDECSRRLVSCGPALPETEVKIVDPQTLTQMPDDGVGEIWVRGPGVALGYWQRPDDSQALFQARIAKSGDGPFLRTGDLGFLHQGKLYPTGRLKEMMIFCGRNVYPQDIEHTVVRCHEALKEHGGAAFSLEIDSAERLVVVQEVLRPAKLDLEALANSIRQALLQEQQLPLYALVLIKSGSLPKTSSGKVQRLLARQQFLHKELQVVHEWAYESALQAADGVVEPTVPTSRTPAEIQVWLQQKLATCCGVAVTDIDVSLPLNHYVMDSITLVTLAVELQQWLGVNVSPLVLNDTPSIVSLAERLTDPTFYLNNPQQGPVAVETLSESQLDQALLQLLNTGGNNSTTGGANLLS